jgi:hypothetical protein
VDRQKVIGDTILAVQDTILVLQGWRGLLESWRDQGQAEPDEFAEACRQLKEANLWHWARHAGGHGLEALAKAVGVEEFQLNGRYREGTQR